MIFVIQPNAGPNTAKGPIGAPLPYFIHTKLQNQPACTECGGCEYLKKRRPRRHTLMAVPRTLNLSGRGARNAPYNPVFILSTFHLLVKELLQMCIQPHAAKLFLMLLYCTALCGDSLRVWRFSSCMGGVKILQEGSFGANFCLTSPPGWYIVKTTSSCIKR